MKPLREFKDFLNKGVVTKRTPNPVRVDSLIRESDKRRKFVNEMNKKIGISNENANYFIENIYDILIELIRAKLFAEGYKSYGEGAHEAEVSFLRELKFSESDVRYMNNLRYFRNGIKYYGKDFDEEAASKALHFLEKTYPMLLLKVKGDPMKIQIKKPSEEEKQEMRSCGIWEKEISEFPWQYDEKETCLLIEGKVEITTEDGEKVSFGKGDYVVFPKGLKCTWKIIEPVKKYYKFG